MSSVRQAGLGILTALFSSALVFGSMLLALAEGGKHIALAPAPTNTALIATPKPGEPTFTPSPPQPPTETPTAPASTCLNKPPDWEPYDVLPGEDLDEIAQEYGTSVEALRQANCLESDSLVAGSVLFVPPPEPTPTPTSTATPQTPTATEEIKPTKAPQRQEARCTGHPSGWVAYKVKKGDTLYRIAIAYGLSIAELKAANCLTSNNIRGGQIIFVPNYAPKPTKRAPTPRPTPRPPVRTEVPPVKTKPPPVVTAPPPVEPEPPPAESPPPAASEPANTEAPLASQASVATNPPLNP